MGTSATNEPAWVRNPPARFDIVATYFPERNASEKPGLKLRPGLVVSVHQGKGTGAYACRIAYGTKNLKIQERTHLDVIVQNASHLPLLGLHRATRFDLDHIIMLPWNKDFFGCWSGNRTPVIGALIEVYIREFAYLMMGRGSAKSKS
jgi:hypothetical protein